jgi:tRNAThr (cytosine32-N3)-methyltransferase
LDEEFLDGGAEKTLQYYPEMIPSLASTATALSSLVATEGKKNDASVEPVFLIPPNPIPGCPSHPLFDIEQLGIDRRLLVNRKRQLKMYRVWVQGKFRKSHR